MFLSFDPNLEPFASCGKVCEDCAEKASTLTPDRKIYISCRYAASWTKKVVEDIENHALSTETLMSCAHACERCDELCRESILPCCRVCAAQCAFTAKICYELVMNSKKKAA